MAEKGARPRLLIVGGFAQGSDGLTGGTLVACRQLLASPFAEAFDMTLIDVSQRDAIARRLPSRMRSALGRIVKLAQLLLRRRLDVALIFATIGPSWFERGLMALMCRFGGVKCFLFPRCADVVVNVERSRFVRAFTSCVARAGAHFLFQGESLRKRFDVAVAKARGRTHVVANWIDLTWRDGVTSAPESSLVTVLYMGWLESFKGADVLIEAVEKEQDVLLNCRFVICGEGSERERLEDRARASGGTFEFRGWVHGEEKVRAFSQAHIVVLPSRLEGMPNVLLEGMSVGCPVVASAVGGVPDLVEDGVTGLLVPPGDARALASALVKLVSDPDLRMRLGEAGRVVVERDHDLQSVWPRLAALLGGKTPGEEKAAKAKLEEAA